MNIKQYPAKSIIFREGDPGGEAFILISGKVEILKRAEHGEVQLAVIEKGGVFGEMAFFDADGLRGASARALEDVTVKELSSTDFMHLVECCPTELMPFIRTMIDRMKAMNVRVANAERATVILDTEISRITIEGAGELAGKFAPMVLQLANLPFSIGGYQEGTKPSEKIMLSLPCKNDPQLISNHHCNIELFDKIPTLVDQGSLFRSIVNGKEYGRGRPEFKAPLVKGENKVHLGGYASPYHLRILCE